MKFEVGKEYRTRDGSTARVYATDAGGDTPMHGAWWHEEENRWETEEWTLDGRIYLTHGKSDLDLMPASREFWITDLNEVFDSEASVIEATKELSAVEIIRVREVIDGEDE